MDSRLILVDERDIDAMVFIRRLAEKSSRITRRGAEFVVDDSMVLKQVRDLGNAIDANMATERGLFLIFTEFFASHSSVEASIIVSPQIEDTFKTVFIVRHDDQYTGDHELGTTVHIRELLAAEATFVAAWPNLVEMPDAPLEEEAEDGPTVTTGLDDDAFLVSDLMGAFDTPREPVSYFIFDATPAQVMRELVGVKDYVQHDAEFLVHEVESIEESIEAISLETDEGPVVELRIPMPQKEIAAANARLAARNASGLKARLTYVAEIEDGSDDFLIQPIAEDGHLGAPRKVRMTYD